MSKCGSIALILILFSSAVYSQLDEIWLETGFEDQDSTSLIRLLSNEEVMENLNSLPRKDNQVVLGGYINSIYREAIDSVKILIGLDGIWIDTVYTDQGLFSSVFEKSGKLIDLFISHPDFHVKDTSFIFPGNDINSIMLSLDPKFKIFLRGRAYAGNMPLEGVNVTVKHKDSEYSRVTRGCFYDKEDYWNCLFDGMFKIELTADDPNDSIQIALAKEGLKPYIYNMTFNEYQGEIMQMRMKYQSFLPSVPYNNLNLKLGFPFLSLEQDWFVSLSYYRLLNITNLRRVAYGLDANMYITNITVSHPTFDGLETAKADSSYISTLVGPSALFWFIRPENRVFSSYAGCSFTFDIKTSNLIPQYFIGSRVFLDLNKAIALEVRYCEYDMDITHYTFNPYGHATKNTVSELFTKLHATFGIQIVF